MLLQSLGGWNYPAAFFSFTHGVLRNLRQKPDEASRWHHPCKFVVNKRKSQIEIYLADGILC